MHSQIGIKLYNNPESYSSFVEDLIELNIDSIFLGDSAISDPDLTNSLYSNGFNTYYIFQTFYNPEYLKKHPEAYAITDKGKKAKDEWVEFVCPTDPLYHDYLKYKLKEVLSEYKLTGISLDFIRQFIFWEKVLDSDSHRLVKSCSCSRCLSDRRSSEEIITDIVRELTHYIRGINKNIVVDLHAVPWLGHEYRRDNLSLCGQNLGEIGKIVDFITPMCYSHMLRKEPSWINSVVRDHHSQSKIDIIPAIQVKECYIEEKLTTKDLKSIVESALLPPSKGIIFWSWDNINSGESRELVKKLTSSYRSE